MDWELYERQRATLIFAGVALCCFLLLAFQRSPAVQRIKSFFVSWTFPPQRVFSRWVSPPSANFTVTVPVAAHPSTETQEPLEAPASTLDPHAEQSRALRVLREENARLNQLIGLKQRRRPNLVAAHVVSRDPQRWFQEILLDKGSDDGVSVDDPVIALAESREALVGRVVESGAHTSRVMLIHDSLSAVAATVVVRLAPEEGAPPGARSANGEDGVVEGSNSHDLVLKYLSRGSQVKIGDLVVTSGLGKMFPEGVSIGWVQDIQLDSRQLFLQARLNPALFSHPLRVVGILVRRE